ncbi:hypothetical protein ATANTOWER_003585 [Ataeniobius toweri]|uniref:Uncharacterized protein n=1 Tax=Ataeniobius toweri TaxID=208326 RepID=A0ABU7B5T2_9TELE|nr:hypothetical protein [Ataeniobius toweri]
MVAQWLALLPYSKKVLGSTPIQGSFCMEFNEDREEIRIWGRDTDGLWNSVTTSASPLLAVVKPLGK